MKLIASIKQSLITFIYISVELMLSYDGDQSVFIHAPSTMMNKVCGLCGNYNGNTTDDFMSIGGQQIGNYADFGNAWIDPTETRAVARVAYDTNHPCSRLSADKVNVIHESLYD